MFDVEVFGGELAGLVREYVANETGPLRKKIEVLEKREIPVPKDGRDGKDADPEYIAAEVARAVAQIPPAKDGQNGKDADPEVMLAEMRAAFADLAEGYAKGLGDA